MTVDLSLHLLVLRILADDPNFSFSLDNLALFAHRLYRRPNLHNFLLKK
jgi:hypothetical protein